MAVRAAPHATCAAALLALRLVAGLRLLAWAGPAMAEPEEELAGPRTDPILVIEPAPPRRPEDPTALGQTIDPEAGAARGERVEELVERSPGVQVRRFGGPGDPVELAIRGISGPRVVVLIDGVRVNTAQSGGVDLSTIPSELIERIDVVRGGGSVQTGSDAIGGVVNIVTKRPSAEPTATARLRFGSFGLVQGGASATGRVGDSELSIGYQGLRSDGDWSFRTDREVDGVLRPGRTIDRINNDVENHSTHVRVGHDLNERVRIDFGNELFFGSAGRPGPANGAGALAGQSPTARQRRTRNVAHLKLEAVGEGTTAGIDGSLQLFHRYDRSRFTANDPGPGGSFDSDDRNQSYGLRGELHWEPGVGPMGLDTRLGVELRQDRLDSRSVDDQAREVLGVFLQEKLSLFGDRVRLVSGVRFDWTGDGIGSQWVPGGGIEVLPLPGLRLLANVERSYRVPNFDELFTNERFVRGDPTLRPEDAINWDVGAELGFERIGPLTDVWLQVAWFRNDIDNQIVFQLVSPDVIQATNTGDATSDGWEVGFACRAFGWIAFSGAYTNIDTEREETNTPLPGIAPAELTLRFGLGPADERFELWAERRRTDTFPVSASGNTFVLARTVWDVGLSLDVAELPWIGPHVPAEALRLSVDVRNVEDVTVRDSITFPQPGRQLGLGGEVRW